MNNRSAFFKIRFHIHKLKAGTRVKYAPSSTTKPALYLRNILCARSLQDENNYGSPQLDVPCSSKQHLDLCYPSLPMICHPLIQTCQVGHFMLTHCPFCIQYVLQVLSFLGPLSSNTQLSLFDCKFSFSSYFP